MSPQAVWETKHLTEDAEDVALTRVVLTDSDPEDVPLPHTSCVLMTSQTLS